MTGRMEQVYLEDLRVGQRFTSETYVMEAAVRTGDIGNRLFLRHR